MNQRLHKRLSICLAIPALFFGIAFFMARGAAPAPPTQKIHVLCSFFPVYLFTQNVAAGREGAQVELMLPPALGCPHDYLLTPQDMQKIARADVFVACGLGMEEFLGAPLKRANPGIKLIDASHGIKELILEKNSVLPNPHLFACPATAAKMVMNIGAGLAAADPAGAEIYKKNAAAYAARLTRLADEFTTTVRALPARRIVTEHSVFGYLARACGLEIVAVIEETPGQEPAAAQMIELVRRMRAGGAAAVFVEPQYPAGVGNTIAREAGIPVAVLDPVASGPENAAPDYYEKVMRQNLETLQKVLGKKR